MHYLFMLILFPIITQAMDFEVVKKYSIEQGTALINKESLSSQERTDVFSYWFSLSLIDFLKLKQQHSQEYLMAKELNIITSQLEFLFFEKKVLKNPLSIRDGQQTYSVDLLKEAKHCKAVCCLAVFEKYEPNSIDDPRTLLNQLFAMKEDAGKSNLVLDGSSKKEGPLSATQLLFSMVEKIPYPREARQHLEGYDSIG